MPPRERMAPPKDSLTLLPCFYFVELPLVAASLLALYVLELTQLLQPPQLGVRCCEAALSKPYVDAADEAVPVLMLRSLAFAGPAATIMVCEAVLYLLRRSAERSINAGGCNFNSFLRRTVRFVGVLVFGLCATALLTDVVQLCTGSHAPFFLTVCKPNCSSSCDSFITQDVCTGHDLDAIQAARKTFPSQHATLSAFAAVYVSMYLNSTVPRSTKLLKPLLVFLFALAAALAGLTQVTQHRSHPCDVYVGFLLGAFVAAYLAVHAVGNFNSSDDLVLAPPPPPPKDDPLRALAERGHDSVYNKGPASASESTDEISAVRVPMECLEGLGLQREQASMGSLKRASVDVELLAPRSPMGKENMVTFSNTLPRASVNLNGDPGATGGAEEPVHLVQPVQPLQPVHPVQPIQRRLKAVQVPMDSLRSQQLVSEWKQRSMELRGVEADREPSEEGSEESSVGTDDGGSQVPVDPPSAQPGRLPPGGAKAVATPRPPQMVDMPPPVSPKSALTRAKWLAIAEKSGGVQPRLLQVVAMSKQHGLLGSSGDHPPSSETTFASSRTSSNPSTKKSCAIISVEAHPAPAVMRSPTPPSASSWDWRSNGSDPSLACDPRLAHHLNRSSSFRPRHASAPGPPEPPEPPLPPEDAEWGCSTNRRRTALVLLDREVLDRGGPHRPVQENYYKKMQGGRRCKDQ